MSLFLKETKEFLEVLGQSYIKAVESKSEQINIVSIKDKIIEYWKEWGSLYPINNKSNQLDLDSLFFVGFTFRFTNAIWVNTDDSSFITFIINEFFATVNMYYQALEKSQEDIKFKFWYIGAAPRNRSIWLPTPTKRKLDLLRPYIKLPTALN